MSKRAHVTHGASLNLGLHHLMSQQWKSGTYFRRPWRLTIATLAFSALPLRLASAQHEHPPAAKSDSARADSVRRAQRDTMAAMPGMSHMDHDMGDMMDGPLGISHVRMGSGTSWMPDSSPMHANHKMWGDWTVMLHGVAFGEYDDQGSARGNRQLGVIDWEMLMAMRKVGSGLLHLHGMASLEPLTIGAKGYPLLLQTGESYKGQPLHDRQHPHDLIMELAAMFQQPVARDLALELYGGIAGEPALGPVAFMHRPSAQNDPLSPLGHHWQDATHISYGVLTAGLYSRVWKIEGSWFNGREPNENRWNIDLRRLDSYSGRLTVNPTARLSLASWYGYLASPEELHPEESVHRYGAAALYGGRGIAGGSWASMLLWSANEHGGMAENSVVAETNLELGAKNALFGRAEYVRKSAEDLVLSGVDSRQQFDIQSLVGGYVREIAAIPGGSVGVGGRVSVNFIPSSLERFYGTRTPSGFAVYVRVRPKRMTTKPMAMTTPARDTTMRMPGMVMPGMQPVAPEHAMPMRHDSSSARLSDSSAHDAMPGMKSMPITRSESAKASQTPNGKGSIPHPAAKPAAHDLHPKGQPAKSGGNRKGAKVSKPKPASKPNMKHMPGMKMPGDSTRPR